MFVPAETIATTSQPSADFSVSFGASESASYDETLTEENSYMAVMLDHARSSHCSLPVKSSKSVRLRRGRLP